MYSCILRLRLQRIGWSFSEVDGNGWSVIPGFNVDNAIEDQSMFINVDNEKIQKYLQNVYLMQNDINLSQMEVIPVQMETNENENNLSDQVSYV